MRQSTSFALSAGLSFFLPFALGCGVILAAPAAAHCATTPAADPEPERVLLTTEDGLTLLGTYLPARDAKQRSPGVVLVHTAGSSRAEMLSLATRMQKSGFASLTIDLRGHGESANAALDWKALDAEAQARAFALMGRDVKAGVDFLLSQKTVHSTGVSMLGHGTGCALVARQATRDDRVRDIVLVSPLTDGLAGSLAKDLIDLAGLPMFIALAKDEAPAAKRLVDACNRVVGGESSIESAVLKLEPEQLLTDNRLSSDLARWMKAKAMPTVAASTPDARPKR